MIVAASGHRPDKLGGYDTFTYHRLVDLARAGLKARKATVVISGMALGWDTAVAIAAIEAGLPLRAYIPFPGQDLRWPDADRKRYARLLLNAAVIKTISDAYSPAAMQRRNIAMVDDCDEVLALWNGSVGGTANCLTYAWKKERRIINLWASWQRYRLNPSNPPPP